MNGDSLPVVLHEVEDGPRCSSISYMYRLAEGWGRVTDGVNPCGPVARYPRKRRERSLTDAEIGKLGRVLDKAEVKGGASTGAVAAIHLLMLTGYCKNEILTLRWRDVDLDAGELALADVCGAAAGRAVPRARQSQGHSGTQAGHAHGGHRRRLAGAPDAGQTDDCDSF